MNESQPTAWNCVVLTSDRGSVSVEDVIRAAFFRGELRHCWERLLVVLETERRALENGQGSNETAVQEKSEQFRFARDLITAEETERWLEERGLTLEDFSDYFVRHSCTGAPGERVAPQVVDYLSAPEELRDMLRIELLLGADFDRMATQLAWRIAARQSSGAGSGASKIIERQRTLFFERAGVGDATLPSWLGALGTDERWLDEMLELEAAFRSQSEALPTPEARERMLLSMRLPLSRLGLEMMELESRDAAREAFLCVREDGMEMAAVAQEGGYPFRRTELAFEELPIESQQKFLRAAPGEVLEPSDLGEGFQLCRLVEKTEAELTDERVRQRLDHEIVERHFTELASRFVRWVIPPANAS